MQFRSGTSAVQHVRALAHAHQPRSTCCTHFGQRWFCVFCFHPCYRLFFLFNFSSRHSSTELPLHRITSVLIEEIILKQGGPQNVRELKLAENGLPNHLSEDFN